MLFGRHGPCLITAQPCQTNGNDFQSFRLRKGPSAATHVQTEVIYQSPKMSYIYYGQNASLSREMYQCTNNLMAPSVLTK